MKSQVNPAVAAVVIAILVIVAGFFIYRGATGDAGSKPPGAVGNPGPFAPGGAGNAGMAGNPGKGKQPGAPPGAPR